MKAITIVLGSALITAAAIKAAPALAETQARGQIVVSTVVTADLDLTTRTGLKTLDHRLETAAREVCGTASDADLEGKNDVRKCREDVLASARQRRDVLMASKQFGSVIAVAAAR
jgi:UrcA family protein